MFKASTYTWRFLGLNKYSLIPITCEGSRSGDMRDRRAVGDTHFATCRQSCILLGATGAAVELASTTSHRPLFADVAHSTCFLYYLCGFPLCLGRVRTWQASWQAGNECHHTSHHLPNLRITLSLLSFGDLYSFHFLQMLPIFSPIVQLVDLLSICE